jgi:catechol 2,3-dioxygenase-like lactoylglutathione lyase family enzyme
MIRGAHVILYTADAEADRAFLRDVLDLAHVDSGGGWLIFQLPPAEVAVHPAETSGAVELYLVCDDIDETVADLGARGVEFEGPVSDQGWGRLATLRLPGGGRLGIYEAHHPSAFDLRLGARRVMSAGAFWKASEL